MEQILFRSKILNASKELSQSNVDEMKYLLKGHVGAGVLENIKTQLDVFTSLENLGWISPTSLDFLYKLLDAIDRGDIVNTLKGVPAGNTAPTISTSNRLIPREPINNRIIDNVANQIASDWKRLGRSLEIPESKIEQIDIDYRKVYEKAIQVLRTWTQACTQASWLLLKNALEELPRYDIIRLVESNLTAVDTAPAAPAPASPPALGHPGYIQATSVSEENTQYSTHSNLLTQFTNLNMEEDKHGIRATRELDSSTSSDSEFEVISSHHNRQHAPDTHQPVTSSIIAENPVEPENVEICYG